MLFGGQMNNTRHIGCIDPNCDVQSVVRDAYENAKFLCDQYYLTSPDIEVQEHNSKWADSWISLFYLKRAMVCFVDLEPGLPIQIVYVPSHLYHTLFELFKNAMRAVVEHHGAAARDYPPVQVLIIRGKEDVTIKVKIGNPFKWSVNLIESCFQISDRGGGVTRSDMKNLFHYMYSTAPQPSLSDTDSAPLAGMFDSLLPHLEMLTSIFAPKVTDTACPCHAYMPAIYWAIWRWHHARATARMPTFSWRPSARRLMKCCPFSITALHVSTAHRCRLATGSATLVALLHRMQGPVTCQLKPSSLNSSAIVGRLLTNHT